MKKSITRPLILVALAAFGLYLLRRQTKIIEAVAPQKIIDPRAVSFERLPVDASWPTISQTSLAQAAANLARNSNTLGADTWYDFMPGGKRYAETLRNWQGG